MTHPRTSLTRTAAVRAVVALAAAGAFTLLGSGVAAAHVTAQPGTATQGGYAKVAFRVPSELPTAGTVRLRVTLPVEHPIASVRTSPLPGWTAELERQSLATPIDSHGRTITEAVRAVTWTASPGTRIGPDEFVEFEVSMGRLPEDTDRLVMPAEQTYDDGTVVRWDEVQAPGAPEPEHPAPVLRLVPDPAAVTAAADAPASSARVGSTGAPDRTARWLGGAGLLMGALGLGVGIGAVARTRRSGS